MPSPAVTTLQPLPLAGGDAHQKEPPWSLAPVSLDVVTDPDSIHPQHHASLVSGGVRPDLRPDPVPRAACSDSPFHHTQGEVNTNAGEHGVYGGTQRAQPGAHRRPYGSKEG